MLHGKRFVVHNYVAYAAQRSGVYLAQSRDWLRRARYQKNQGEPYVLCVKYARENWREYLHAMRDVNEALFRKRKSLYTHN